MGSVLKLCYVIQTPTTHSTNALSGCRGSPPRLGVLLEGTLVVYARHFWCAGDRGRGLLLSLIPRQLTPLDRRGVNRRVSPLRRLIPHRFIWAFVRQASAD